MARSAATTSTSPHHPRVPLSWLFFALLALTAAEVLLYEIWHYTGVHYAQPFVPKYVIVLLILLFTLPKAAIVMIYFMHLKFEHQLVVALAIIPFFFAFLGVFTPLSDTLTLKPQAQNRVLQPRDADHHLHAAPAESHAQDAADPAAH